jgi:hypothetical protein
MGVDASPCGEALVGALLKLRKAIPFSGNVCPYCRVDKSGDGQSYKPAALTLWVLLM